MESLVSSQITSAAIVVWFLNRFKEGPLKEFLKSQRAIPRFFASLGALASSAGIGYAYDVETATLTITGLTAAAVVEFLWSVFQQFVMQEMIYRGTRDKKAAASG